jgi:hypothetical protein
VPAKDAPAAGWTRVNVPAGTFTVDVPPGYRQSVSGPLITFVSPVRHRAYSVNGNADEKTGLRAAQTTLVAGYRRSFELGRVTTRRIGANELRLSASGKRRGGAGERQSILAAIVRPPGAKAGLYVVQSFSAPGSSGGRKGALAEFRLVRATLHLGR